MTLAELGAAAVTALVPAIGAFAGGWVAGGRRVRKAEARLEHLAASTTSRHELRCAAFRPISAAPEVTPGLHGFRLRGEEGGGP